MTDKKTPETSGDEDEEDQEEERDGKPVAAASAKRRATAFKYSTRQLKRILTEALALPKTMSGVHSERAQARSAMYDAVLKSQEFSTLPKKTNKKRIVDEARHSR